MREVCAFLDRLPPRDGRAGYRPGGARTSEKAFTLSRACRGMPKFNAHWHQWTPPPGRPLGASPRKALPLWRASPRRLAQRAELPGAGDSLAGRDRPPLRRRSPSPKSAFWSLTGYRPAPRPTNTPGAPRLARMPNSSALGRVLDRDRLAAIAALRTTGTAADGQPVQRIGAAGPPRPATGGSCRPAGAFREAELQRRVGRGRLPLLRPWRPGHSGG